MSGRRGDEPLSGPARAIWAPLARLCDGSGVNQGRLFEDWIELMLQAYLSLGWNFGAGRLHPSDFDGPHEAAYVKLASRYKDERAGMAPFFEAHAELLQAIAADPWIDPLGQIFEARVSFGERGQYFTPWPVCSLLASLNGGELPDGASVLDPACGSGRMLLAMAERNRRLVFHGVDLDGRCARMAAINLCLRGLSGEVRQADALGPLSAAPAAVWRLRDGWIEEIPSEAASPAPMPDSIDQQAIAAGRLFV